MMPEAMLLEPSRSVLQPSIGVSETASTAVEDGFIRAPAFPQRRNEPSTAVLPNLRNSPDDDQRLRIAIVSPEVSSGAGVPHYWLALAKALAPDHDLHVFTSKADRPRPEGVHFHRIPALPVGWFLPHLTFYAVARLRFLFASLFQPRPFDVVLGVGALTPFADVSTVHFVQAREIELEQQGLIPRRRPRAGLAALDYAIYSRTMGWLGRRFYKDSRASIVAISQSVKRDIALFEGANPAAISVVPNGVDIDRFTPENRELYRESTRESLGLSDDQTAVLFVGNSWGRKGLRTAIQAIAGPDQQNMRLLVVGEGDPSAFVDHLPGDVVDRIIFVGSRSKDVERLYAAADVFMLPTLYEPFGLVILEALASGVPSIFSACAGASEWLEDGVDAVFLQDPVDGDEARAALRSIVDSPDFARTLAANGREAAQRLQWGRVGASLIAAAGSAKSLVLAKA